MKKRKLYLFIIYSLVIGASVFFITNLNSTLKDKMKIDTWPKLGMVDTTGYEIFSEPKGHTVLIFYNGECHLCTELADQLRLHKTNDIRWVWISSEAKHKINSFNRRYQFHLDPDIRFVHDPDNRYFNYWQVNTTPHIFIYTKSGKLLKSHKGPWKIENLLQWIIENR